MTDKTWYIAVAGQQQGPFSLGELYARFQSRQLGADTHVFTQGMANWELASQRPELAGAFAAAGPTVPPPPAFAAAHEIEHEIHGAEMQFVEVTLDPQEACIAEAGGFMYMDPGIDVETIFGDGTGGDGGGFMGKLLNAGKRVLTGESLFMSVFANVRGPGKQKVAFAAPYPGRIVAVDLRQHGGRLICQKDSFLCAARGISVGIAFQRNLGVGLFGGEGFILQKLEGDGFAFVHACGTVVERTLAVGETMRLDTGCLVAFEQQVGYDIQTVKGVKTALFGGEGLFYAALTGPGKVWIQSLPFSRLARKVLAYAPQTGGARRGEGSVLGGIGDLVMGGGD